MNPALLLSLCALSGYLVGSFSSAVVVAKAHGVDIFAVGSGNPGATNVKRSIGKGPGNLVFLLDLLKGFIVALWPFLPALHEATTTALPPVVLSLAGLIGALLGHSFSIYIRFRGGKGVATAMGGLLAIMAPVVLLGMAVWLAFFYAFRYVSLASLAFAASLPLFSALFWWMDWQLPRSYTWIECGIAAAIFLLILIRHQSNISRLLKGTEHKFETKRPASTGDSSPS